MKIRASWRCLALGHPNPRLLFKHYRQLVTAKSAKTYWNIVPADPSTITNIKNNHRLITAIHYNTGKIFILNILTHAQYDKINWKKEL